MTRRKLQAVAKSSGVVAKPGDGVAKSNSKAKAEAKAPVFDVDSVEDSRRTLRVLVQDVERRQVMDLPVTSAHVMQLCEAFHDFDAEIGDSFQRLDTLV